MSDRTKASPAAYDDIISKISNILKTFKINVLSITADIRSTGVMYRIVPGPGIRPAAIANLHREIAFALGGCAATVIEYSDGTVALTLKDYDRSVERTWKVGDYYDVDGSGFVNLQKQAYMERIGSECAAEDIPFFLEILAYDENIEDNGYTVLDTETLNLTGTTDTTAAAEIKTFEHFTYNSTNKAICELDGDESEVFVFELYVNDQLVDKETLVTQLVQGE